MRFRDWSLAKKYGAGVAIVLILMALGMARSFQQLLDLKADLESVSRNWMGRVIAISDINRSTSDLRMLQLQYASTHDPSVHSMHAGAIIALIDRINDNRDRYEDLRQMSGPARTFMEKEEALYGAFDRHWDEFQSYSLSVVELTMEGNREQAVRVLADEARQVFDSMSISLTALIEVNQSYALDAADRAEGNLRHLRNTSAILFCFTIGLSIVFTIWLVRQISRPIRKLAVAAQEVAGGDLSVRLPVAGEDEVGRLSRAFNEMTVALSDAHERTERQRLRIERANEDLQEALRQLHEAQGQLILQEKMASLGQLVAGVSHELNTPAGALLSAGDVSERVLAKLRTILNLLPADGKDENTRALKSLLNPLADSIAVTMDAGNRIQGIVGSLRNFVRLDEAEYQMANLIEGIESSITLLGAELLRRIAIQREYGELPKVACHPAQINQVFFNILRNAAQAIDGEGRITIQTSADAERVTIRISDTGRGIEPERLRQVWDVNWSARGARVRMGSGLLTAYNIVRRHNGDLAIDSEPGRGTSVTITLPLGNTLT